MRVTFKSVDFEQSRRPSLPWVGLIQSVEGLHRKKSSPLKRREACPEQPSSSPDGDISSSLGLSLGSALLPGLLGAKNTWRFPRTMQTAAVITVADDINWTHTACQGESP